MYKGKRRRLRKKDLNAVNTFEWTHAIHLTQARVEFIFPNGLRGLWSKMKSRLDIHGQSGDNLDLMVNLKLFDKAGNVVIDRPFVLLPDIAGRKYYWVDEEQA